MDSVEISRADVRDLHKEAETDLWTDPRERVAMYYTLVSLGIDHPLNGPCPFCDEDPPPADLWR